MISITSNEYSQGDLAIRETKLSIFNIVIWESTHTTTNKDVIKQLAKNKTKINIKGFNYDN